MRPLGRWLINGLTTLSLLLLAATCAMWARSEWVAEQFYFAPEAAASFPNLDGTLVPAMRSRWIGSTTGRLCFGTITVTNAASSRSEEMQRPAGYPERQYTVGYVRGLFEPVARAMTFPGYRLNGVRALTLPGFQWFRQPPQFSAAPNPPVPSPGGGVLGDAFFTGRQSLSVAYWLVAVLLVVLPATRALFHWRRRRKSKRVGLCPGCGYDLRASPDRCPECGMAVAASP